MTPRLEQAKFVQRKRAAGSVLGALPGQIASTAKLSEAIADEAALAAIHSSRPHPARRARWSLRRNSGPRRVRPSISISSVREIRCAGSEDVALFWVHGMPAAACARLHRQPVRPGSPESSVQVDQHATPDDRRLRRTFDAQRSGLCRCPGPRHAARYPSPRETRCRRPASGNPVSVGVEEAPICDRASQWVEYCSDRTAKSSHSISVNPSVRGADG
jgi:hypothetical protein